ncbi:RHS repeat domain-containing protein [Xylanibacter ruminicola]|nr:RHS repeat-associated core domain-containing protein [Xylanibacter ruminicola]
MKNGKVDKYLFAGGYAQASVASATTDNFAFYFYNQDHLGSIREVVDASGAVKQVNNYYPFGAPYADTSSSTNSNFQPYKYNGKELDKMHGLNTFDYGARQYDPILARWDRNDPLCEKYYDISPYAYCMNNPIKYIDKNGDSTRVYVEVNKLGHAWLSVGEGDNQVVYSYGRYNGTYKHNPLSNGDGVLLRLTGEKAKEYMENKKAEGLSSFIIGDVSDNDVMSYVDNIFYSSAKLPDEKSKDYNKNTSARVIDKYKLLSNNCTTFVSDVLNGVGSNVLNEIKTLPTSSFGTFSNYETKGRFVNPRSLLKHLNTKSLKSNSYVYKR